ncbi:hypothetical protein BJ085DRAFT_39479 [Dimargaris cristalligena]|uniref:CUE domain-containing protein n=1 Tax=Dimargaris cristalligena TaxID=215637 RepID=A0A4P9ZNF5_9FUNG|nr:hypothetical protein BJ085DRAFT_39479 [Dimargaris cristalligena]|eukprot:RKP34072.1 hypothetical protein BJ085DRAFT_39479 [Dimargaris cristalligena]
MVGKKQNNPLLPFRDLFKDTSPALVASWSKRLESVARRSPEELVVVLEAYLRSAKNDGLTANDRLALDGVPFLLEELAQYVVGYDLHLGDAESAAGWTSLLNLPTLNHSTWGHMSYYVLRIYSSLLGGVGSIGAGPRVSAQGQTQLGKLAHEMGWFNAGPLNHFGLVFSSRWADQFARPPTPVGSTSMPALKPFDIVQYIAVQCWVANRLLAHGFRVVGHEMVSNIDREIGAVMGALPDLTNPDSGQPMVESESESEWHKILAATAQAIRSLTRCMILLRANPRAAWIQFAEQETLLGLAQTAFYRLTEWTLRLDSSQQLNDLPTATRQTLERLLGVVLPWTLASLVYILIVLNGFPREPFLEAWVALWGGPSADPANLQVILDDLQTQFVEDTDFATGRMERLSRSLMALIEITQECQPTASTGHQPSLWILLNQRFQLYTWLLEVQRNNDSEAITYTLMFFDNQLEKAQAADVLDSQMNQLSVRDQLPRLSSDIIQALDLSQYMETKDLQMAIDAIRGVFPDLGDGFIWASLAVNGYKQEEVIMQLLEDRVPEVLANLERGITREEITTLLNNGGYAEPNPSASMAPAASTSDSGDESSDDDMDDPLLHRRNIFDNDEFDVFTHGQVADPNRVYRKAQDDPVQSTSTVTGGDDWLSAQRQDTDYKQRIIDRAIATLAEDDEHDDTYDDPIPQIYQTPLEGVESEPSDTEPTRVVPVGVAVVPAEDKGGVEGGVVQPVRELKMVNRRISRVRPDPQITDNDISARTFPHPNNSHVDLVTAFPVAQMRLASNIPITVDLCIPSVIGT